MQLSGALRKNPNSDESHASQHKNKNHQPDPTRDRPKKRINPIAKIMHKIPLTINPKLNTNIVTPETTPKSLRALFIQLNWE